MSLRSYFVISLPLAVLLLPGCGKRDHGEGDLRDLTLIPLIYRDEDAEFFNDLLRSDDIVAAYAGRAHMLELIQTPRRLLVFPAIAVLDSVLDQLEGIYVDYVNYNPERWITHGTPRAELEDIAGAVTGVRIRCEREKTRLCFTPDAGILEQEGEEVVPLVDMFGIQAQRYQRKSHEEFHDTVCGLVAGVRRCDPQVPIILQLSMAPPVWEDGRFARREKGEKLLAPVTAEEVLAMVECIENVVDGIAILYTEESREEMKELVRSLRPKGGP